MRRVLAVFSIIVFSSSNGSAQWEQLPGPPGSTTSGYVQRALVKSTFSGALFAPTRDGVFLSGDHGKSWSHRGLQGMTISCLLQYQWSKEKEILLAVVELPQRVIFRSLDGGLSWDSTYASKDPIQGLFQDHERLIIVTYGYDAVHCVIQSIDSGRTWTNIAGPPSPFTLQNVVKSGQYILGVGSSPPIWRIPITGGSWEPIDEGNWNYSSALSSWGDTVVLGAKGGPHISTDNGDHWFEPVNSGLSDTSYFYSFASNGSAILAETDSGLYRSTDVGNSWIRLYSYGRIEYADGAYFLSGAELLRSEDAGSTWMSAANGLTSAAMDDVSATGSLLFAATGAGFFQSMNNGQQWNADSAPMPRWFNVKYQRTDSTLFAFGDNLYQWDGSHWRILYNGSIRSFAKQDSTLFVLTGRGIQRSEDNGNVWSRDPIPFQNWGGGYSIDNFFSAGDKLFLYMSGWDITTDQNGHHIYELRSASYVSRDRGTTWVSADNYSFGSVPLLWVDKPNGRFYQYISDSLLVSDDTVHSWTKLCELPSVKFLTPFRDGVIAGVIDTAYGPTGLVMVSGKGKVTRLIHGGPLDITSFTADDKYAYIGTTARGIWRMPLNALAVEPSSKKLQTKSMFTIFPNPAIDKVWISLSLDAPRLVSVGIYDACGIEHNHFSRDVRETNIIDLSLQLKDLPNGLYVVALSAGPLKAYQKLIIDR